MNSRIAIYLPSLRGGGAERVMVTLANCCSERGYRIDLVLARAEGPYLADVSPKVRIVDLGASRVLTSLPALVAYVRRDRPSALLSAQFHANIAAIIARWISRVPTHLVVTEHNKINGTRVNAISMRERAKVFLMRRLYPVADGVVAVSKGLALDLASTTGLPIERINVIHNPVVTTSMLEHSRQPLDHPWFSLEGPPVILGVGRLTAQKDFSLLIRAFAKLRAQRNARLMILGEGELRDELETLVRHLGLEADVALPGFVINPYAYMRQSALHVLSSRWEGFGNVLAEAMACGTPVVATNCQSGPAEILENGRWGRLVPVGDIDALARAMDSTLGESDHPDVENRATAFGVDQAVTKYLHVITRDA